MRLTEITYGQALAIEGYGPGFFRVGTHLLRGACMVTPWDAGAWGGMDDSATPLALLGPDRCAAGRHRGRDCPCGTDFRAALEEAGIGVEVMNSPAACRTYNVLLGEGRRIAACLLPV